MEVQAPELPATPAGVPPIPIWGTVRQALDMVISHPRETMFPFGAVEVPVALLSSIASVVLYFTIFGDQPFHLSSDLLADPGLAPGHFFALLMLLAFQGLFAQVARAAAAVSIAGVATGKPRTLTESLDPAFTRMGGLLVVALIPVAIVIALLFSMVGLILIPFVALRLALSLEVFILEGLPPVAALRRSWSLFENARAPGERPGSLLRQIFPPNMLRLLGVLVVMALVAAVPVFVVGALGGISGGGRTARVIEDGLFTFTQAVVLVPVLAFVSATTTLFYLQLRTRHDARPVARY